LHYSSLLDKERAHKGTKEKLKKLN